MYVYVTQSEKWSTFHNKNIYVDLTDLWKIWLKFFPPQLFLIKKLLQKVDRVKEKKSFNIVLQAKKMWKLMITSW